MISKEKMHPESRFVAKRVYKYYRVARNKKVLSEVWVHDANRAMEERRLVSKSERSKYDIYLLAKKLAVSAEKTFEDQILNTNQSYSYEDLNTTLVDRLAKEEELNFVREEVLEDLLWISDGQEFVADLKSLWDANLGLRRARIVGLAILSVIMMTLVALSIFQEKSVWYVCFFSGYPFA